MFKSSERIDVVVPIYKGQHYIKGIIRQLEGCLERMDEAIDIGLVLVNDDPDDSFNSDYFSDRIEILAVETEQNEGIHGARVKGFSYCRGDYAVFLDQDDKVSPDYFRSQLAALGEADAVVCRAANGGRQFYDCDKQFEKLISITNMFSVGNGILSPGQVLMRRAAVSQFWKDNILRYNGADDWLLWLCMMHEGKHFAINQDTVYEHTLNNGNCSGSTLRMYWSERNMYEILEEKKYFDEAHLGLLRLAIYQGLENRLKELDKLKNAMEIYDKWLEAGIKNKSIVSYLKSEGCYKVAIYGLGKMGIRLYQEIKAEIDVVCFVDRNANYLEADIPVYMPDEIIPQVDLIIIALGDRENKILENVSEMIDYPVRGLEEILQVILTKE